MKPKQLISNLLDRIEKLAIFGKVHRFATRLLNRRWNLSSILASFSLGIELENEVIKIAKISLQRDVPYIEKLDTFSCVDFNKSSHKIFDKNLTISGLRGSDILVRPLEVKLKKEKEIQSVLSFQAEPHLPFPIENALLQSMKVSETQSGSLCTILACRKDLMKYHLELWEKYAITPEQTSCIPIALLSFSTYFFPNDLSKIRCIVHRDSKEIICILAQNGLLLASHSTPYRKETCEGEIIKMVTLFYNQCRMKDSFDILLTGEMENLQDIIKTLSDIFHVPVLPPPSVANYSFEQIQKFVIPIGLGLSALSPQTDSINFRTEEFTASFPWKRMRNILVFYFSLSLSLSLILAYGGNLWLGYQEDQVKQEYTNMLSFSSKSNEKLTPVLLQQLSLEEITNRIIDLQETAQPSPDLFPLHPNIPRLSDVLAWLSTHPQVLQNHESKEAALKIESFVYALMKRPDKNKRQEKYQVKIDLEFTTPIPKFAREFHDALRTANQMVDPKGEIKWHAARDRYRTSFFLKDKTQYSIN